MNIKLLRLSTGEDLIADLHNWDAAGATVENPCIIYITQTQAGGHNVGMTRWMPYAADKQFLIDAKFVVTIADPAEDLAKQYDQVFGAGLIIPKQSLEIAK